MTDQKDHNAQQADLSDTIESSHCHPGGLERVSTEPDSDSGD